MLSFFSTNGEMLLVVIGMDVVNYDISCVMEYLMTYVIFSDVPSMQVNPVLYPNDLYQGNKISIE